MSGDRSGEPGARGARRALAYAVLLCLAGAGLALFAATRAWAVEVTPRPAPLPAIRLVRTGGDLLPWLPALALVGLAGAGAVLATRARSRRAVGGLLLVVGAAVAAGAGSALLNPDTAATGAGWPSLCVVGGLALAGGGGWTALRGQRWPAMGARYERGTGTGGEESGGGGRGGGTGLRAPGSGASGSGALGSGALGSEAADSAPAGPTGHAAGDPVSGGAGSRAGGWGLVESWNALDRGEDPTLNGPDEPQRPDRS